MTFSVAYFGPAVPILTRARVFAGVPPLDGDAHIAKAMERKWKTKCGVNFSKARSIPARVSGGCIAFLFGFYAESKGLWSLTDVRSLQRKSS